MGVDEKPQPAFLDQLKKVFGFEPPRARGHHVVNAVQAMVDGRAKVFIGLGGNFVRAVPDWTAAEAAMRRLRLTVAVSTKLNRGHLVHGEEALILPVLARSDIDMQAGGRQSVTVEDSMSMVHASSGLVEPPSEHLKSEVAIVCGMAKADSARLRHRLGLVCRRLQPNPRQDRGGFPPAVRRLQRRIHHPGGFHLTTPPRERVWNTATGRANFLVFSGVDEDAGDLRPACFGSRRCEAMISTIRRSTASTTAIAACSAAAWSYS